MQLCEGRPARRRRDVQLPEAIDAVVRQALAKRQEGGYQTLKSS